MITKSDASTYSDEDALALEVNVLNGELVCQRHVAAWDEVQLVDD